jgi:hypothetical protein
MIKCATLNELQLQSAIAKRIAQSHVPMPQIVVRYATQFFFNTAQIDFA